MLGGMAAGATDAAMHGGSLMAVVQGAFMGAFAGMIAGGAILAGVPLPVMAAAGLAIAAGTGGVKGLESFAAGFLGSLAGGIVGGYLNQAISSSIAQAADYKTSLVRMDTNLDDMDDDMDGQKFNCTAQQRQFFALMKDPAAQVAEEYNFDPNFLLGLSAYESGWLGEHAMELNNPFGLTNAGGADLSYDSIADAISSWGSTYGPKAQGASTIQEFVNSLQVDLRPDGLGPYNSANPNWGANVIATYHSVIGRIDWCGGQ